MEDNFFATAFIVNLESFVSQFYISTFTQKQRSTIFLWTKMPR